MIVMHVILRSVSDKESPLAPSNRFLTSKWRFFAALGMTLLVKTYLKRY